MPHEIITNHNFLFQIPSKAELDTSGCQCQPWQTCSWSEKAMNLISGLPQTHVSYKSLAKFFQDRICDVDTRNIYCCNNGTYPKATQTKITEEGKKNLDHPKID